MAQYSAQTTGSDFYAAVSTDGSSYTDISGGATLVEPKKRERKHGEAHTGEGDQPIKAYGKQEAQEWEATIIYTKTAGQAYKLLQSAFANKTRLNIRYCPEGNTTGNDRFTLSGADVRVVELDFPTAEASNEKPVACKATFVGGGYTEDSVP